MSAIVNRTLNTLSDEEYKKLKARMYEGSTKYFDRYLTSLDYKKYTDLYRQYDDIYDVDD